MSYTGQSYKYGPTPAGYQVAAPPGYSSETSVPPEEKQPKDPRVAWAEKTERALKREREPITREMRRNVDFYNGGTPWWKNRPKWKVASRLNYCFYIPTQWAAILVDNRPKVSYSAYRKEDQRDADIMTAAFTDSYTSNNWQQVIHDAVLLSRIVKKSFLRLTYDQHAQNSADGHVLTPVSGMQVYVDMNATSVSDANVLMYEYPDAIDAIVARYPSLEGRLHPERVPDRQNDRGTDQDSPAQQFQAPTDAKSRHYGPYTSDPNPPAQSSGGVWVKEFWTRPKGPRYEIEVTSLRFNANNQPATEPKFIEYEDGHIEPLQLVLTEGGYLYELPMSIVTLSEWAMDFGGIRILEKYDAVEPVFDKVKRPLYPHGRLMVRVQDHIADDGMNPFYHGHFPFVEIDGYRNPTAFFGFSDIDQVADLYEYACRLFSLFLDAALLTGNPIWRLPLSSDIADEDITNAPGAVQREDINSLRFGKRESGPDMPQYLMKLLEFCLEQMRVISGLTDVATGAKPKGQISSDTASMFQEAAGVRFRDALHNLESALVELGYQYRGNVAQFSTQPRIVTLKRAANVMEPVTFFGYQISSNLRLEAKAGSMMPTSPTARLNTLINLFNGPKPLVDVREVYAALAEAGIIDSGEALYKRVSDAIKNPARAWEVLGVGGGPGGKNNRGSTKSHKSVRGKSRGPGNQV